MIEHQIAQQAKASGNLELVEKWTHLHVRMSQLYLQLASLSEKDEVLEHRFREIELERNNLYQEINHNFVAAASAKGVRECAALKTPQ